jgi:hypothetical protein
MGAPDPLFGHSGYEAMWAPAVCAVLDGVPICVAGNASAMA